ncbi:MAG: hypothetical protein OXG84_00235, partial [Chloroflexi bacterium]|nr:hypothetical protein [Chloroflexota bacterium]
GVGFFFFPLVGPRWSHRLQKLYYFFFFFFFFWGGGGGGVAPLAGGCWNWEKDSAGRARREIAHCYADGIFFFGHLAI